MSSNLNIFIYDTVVYNSINDKKEEKDDPIGLYTERINNKNKTTKFLKIKSTSLPLEMKRRTSFIPESKLNIIYDHIGTMNIDFYDNFKTLKKEILMQSNEFFEKYSFLYYSNSSNNEDFNLKILRDFTKTFVGEIFDTNREIIGEVNMQNFSNR